MSQTVYIVVRSEWDDWEVLGAFTEERDAKRMEQEDPQYWITEGTLYGNGERSPLPVYKRPSAHRTTYSIASSA